MSTSAATSGSLHDQHHVMVHHHNPYVQMEALYPGHHLHHSFHHPHYRSTASAHAAAAAAWGDVSAMRRCGSSATPASPTPLPHQQHQQQQQLFSLEDSQLLSRAATLVDAAATVAGTVTAADGDVKPTPPAPGGGSVVMHQASSAGGRGSPTAASSSTTAAAAGLYACTSAGGAAAGATGAGMSPVVGLSSSGSFDPALPALHVSMQQQQQHQQQQQQQHPLYMHDHQQHLLLQQQQQQQQQPDLSHLQQHHSTHHHHMYAAAGYPTAATSLYYAHHHHHHAQQLQVSVADQPLLQHQHQVCSSGGSPTYAAAAAAAAAIAAAAASNIGSADHLDYDPRELEAFAERFKQRRIKLGVTQADVGKALGNLKLPGVGALSQSTICRFESLTLSHNNMIALKPVLQAWLEEAEHIAMERQKNPDVYGDAMDKKRKRTSITDAEKRSLEAYFQVQPRPSSEKIAQIADKLNLKKNVVRVWFCNQRQKQKRMKFATPIGLHPMSPQ